MCMKKHLLFYATPLSLFACAQMIIIELNRAQSENSGRKSPTLQRVHELDREDSNRELAAIRQLRARARLRRAREGSRERACHSTGHEQ